MIRQTLLSVVFAAASLMAANPKVEEAKRLVKEGKYDEAVTAVDTAYKANPKSAELKAGVVETRLAAGDYYMNNPAMPPRMKYPAALKQYREVLLVDKTNDKAKKNVEMIEGIYKSMGRPVPQ